MIHVSMRVRGRWTKADTTQKGTTKHTMRPTRPTKHVVRIIARFQSQRYQEHKLQKAAQL